MNEDINVFDELNIPESNWFKMEKVGDRISGEVVEISEQPAKDEFPAQRVFSLKQKDGTIVKYGAKYPKMVEGKMQGSDYLINRSNHVECGDIVGFEFKKEIPPSRKGFNPAKQIEIYVVKGKKPEADPIADGLNS